jgi:hypothetical protein
MKSLGLASAVFSLLAAACGDFGAGTCTDDPGGRHHALNPATGECWEFASSCDVPAEWASCGGDPECDDTHACPPDRTCQAGVCVLVGTGCTSDLDCPNTQHCEFPPTPAPGAPDIAIEGTCVDNATCTDDTQCPDGQWCDWTAGDCDPTAPDCGIAAGLCTRAPRPGMCNSANDCMTGEVCTSDWTGMPPGTCEISCYDDTTCAAPGTHCNAAEVCLTPHPKPDRGRSADPSSSGGSAESDAEAPLIPLCAGWCLI